MPFDYSVEADRYENQSPVALQELEQRSEDEGSADVYGVLDRTRQPDFVPDLVRTRDEQGEPSRLGSVELVLQERLDLRDVLSELSRGIVLERVGGMLRSTRGLVDE